MLIQQLNWFIRSALRTVARCISASCPLPVASYHSQFGQINLVRNHVDKQLTLRWRPVALPFPPLALAHALPDTPHSICRCFGCPFSVASFHFVYRPRTACPSIVKEHWICWQLSNVNATSQIHMQLNNCPYNDTYVRYVQSKYIKWASLFQIWINLCSETSLAQKLPGPRDVYAIYILCNALYMLLEEVLKTISRRIVQQKLPNWKINLAIHSRCCCFWQISREKHKFKLAYFRCNAFRK